MPWYSTSTVSRLGIKPRARDVHVPIIQQDVQRVLLTAFSWDPKFTFTTTAQVFLNTTLSRITQDKELILLGSKHLKLRYFLKHFFFSTDIVDPLLRIARCKSPANIYRAERTMYQRKVDEDMLNAVVCVLADVSSVSPLSEL